MTKAVRGERDSPPRKRIRDDGMEESYTYEMETEPAQGELRRQQ